MAAPDSLRRVFLGSVPETVQENCTTAVVARIANEKKATTTGTLATPQTTAYRSPIVQSDIYNGYAAYGAVSGATSATSAYLSTGRQQQSYITQLGSTTATIPGLPEQPIPPPQPSQWLTYYTPEGHPYYYNVLTKVTQWEKPAELATPQAVIPLRPLATPMAQAAMMSITGLHQQRATLPEGDVLGTRRFGPPGCNLFIFHIPSEWGHRELYEHFRFFGKIVSARVKTGSDDSNRNLGFGFVSYETPESAITAIKSMHGFHVGSKWLKVTLKKGEEHLLPPDLQAMYAKATKEADQTLAMYQLSACQAQAVTAAYGSVQTYQETPVTADNTCITNSYNSIGNLDGLDASKEVPTDPPIGPARQSPSKEKSVVSEATTAVTTEQGVSDLKVQLSEVEQETSHEHSVKNPEFKDEKESALP